MSMDPYCPEHDLYGCPYAHESESFPVEAACPVPGAPLTLAGYADTWDSTTAATAYEPAPVKFPDDGNGRWPAIDWAEVGRKVKADNARRPPVTVTPLDGESDGETLRRDRIANGRCRQVKAPAGTPDRLDARAHELEATALELRTLANVLRMRALLNPADRAPAADPAPRYRIEVRGAHAKWFRAYAHSDTYGRYEAEEICSDHPGLYRMVPDREART